MNSKKTANLLTICIKAGKTVKGFDSACDTVKNGTAYCILTASDASEKTVKEMDFICRKYSVKLIKTELSKEDMGRLCGKVTAVIAVCDKGFADGFIKINA
ncbi:MAG: ribosomal L7Ae/L30e/S12e/Gadd45 family protein [Ruminococcus flavefaciens]|nr:ribosomal L7Ae/L30e/S12e/Gadd45 family protein [Ruminococcus flavefaciens]